MMYSLDEVTILPCSEPSEIYSRSLVNPFDENGKLPIFVSPMTCVINRSNYEVFNNSKVIPIIPRGISNCVSEDTNWAAYSLSDFERCLNYDLNNRKLLIDIANGHMKVIYDLVKIAKDKWPNVTIMVGNIANPSLYKTCCEAGVDYVRLGIGGGNGCSTSCLTGVHASIPYLLNGIREIKSSMSSFSFKTKVVADGGISTVDRAIKCLALGADYVMMGKTFAQCEEACGRIVDNNGKKYREYYGMASSKGQEDISGGFLKNPEGIVTLVPVKTSLSQYCSVFESSLRSAMTYTGSPNLNHFKNFVQTDVQSASEFNAFNKNEVR